MNMKLLIGFCLLTVTLGRQGFGPTDQEWGYITVREGAHMFWWLHYTTATTKPTEKPLIIYLQGGPGRAASEYGNFEELGPWDRNQNPRNHTWVQHANILFIDNPVGTGFSYVENSTQFTKTNKEIADDFVVLMQGFYKQLPQFEEVPLYIFSESYGGKMAVEIALNLYQVSMFATQNGTLKSNLKGVGLGAPWISPVDSCLNWAPYLYNLGYLDTQQYKLLDTQAQDLKQLVDNGKWAEASKKYTDLVVLIYTYTYQSNALFLHSTSIVGPNVKPDDGVDKTPEKINLMNNLVKNALNLSQDWDAQSQDVIDNLNIDDMKPVTDIVERLLNETDLTVAVYNGQVDLLVPTPGTVNWVDRLNFKGSENWTTASKEVFEVDGIYEGFEKKTGNFAFYWLLRTGHTVGRKGFGPTDQEWGYVDVREGAHMFWWLHYTASTTKPTDKPLIIWLQGGPGRSATQYGNFEEIGPWNSNQIPRFSSWVNGANILFVDNPVGVGFSYVENSQFAKSDQQIATDFVVLMKAFYKQLPQFEGVPLHIFSESYGGKMAVEIALQLYQANKNGTINCNLKGVGLGAAWISPVDSCLTWAPYLYNLGILDTQQYNLLDKQAQDLKQLANTGKWAEAADKYIELLTWVQTKTNTSTATFLNVLAINGPNITYNAGVDQANQRLMNELVKPALNLTRNWTSPNRDAFNNVKGDFMKPVPDLIEQLLNDTDVSVAVYNGQLDLFVPTPGTMNWVDKLNFKGSKDWTTASREAFAVQGFYQGYEKKAGNFTFYWLLRAGHEVRIL
ncbi:unnamed protein product [Ceutorhynchus assimilis]|uniref:Carboxypeptidase n=1 Tax=Ceutorhynchus assimilis TaxID=467358 RepID=A0A9N9MPW8_9CUCU|nr:unnamed protein product [Ceutorhynchus assimilis]